MNRRTMQADRRRVSRLYRLERAAAAMQYRVVCGMDEAGRGALAGPVVVAAVVLKPGTYIPLLQDSKLLTPKKREMVFREVKKRALAVGVGIVDHAGIDEQNILRATKTAMKKALKALSPSPDLLILDAVTLDDVPIPARVLVRADRKSASVAAASVIAKVIRDRMMDDLDAEHPGYGFSRNKGYGTRAHVRSLERQGPSAVHRRTFAPVAQVSRQMKVMAAGEE